MSALLWFWWILSALVINSHSVFFAGWVAAYIYNTHIFTEDLDMMMCENESEEQIWKSGFACFLWPVWFNEVANSTDC